MLQEKWAWNELDIDAFKAEKSDKPAEEDAPESIYSKFAYHSRGLEDEKQLDHNESGEVGSKEMRRRRAVRASQVMGRRIHRAVQTRTSSYFSKWRSDAAMVSRAKAALFHLYQRDLCDVWNAWRLDAWERARAFQMMRRAVNRLLKRQLSS